MKPLNKYMQEKLIVNKNYNTVKYHPTTLEELRQIIEERFDKFEPGTAKAPIDFNDVDVSKLTSFSMDGVGIFENTKFEYIDISNWDVSNVENISFMFFYCDKLKSLGDISDWDVSKVEDMTGMFADCKNLKSVGDLSKWNVSNVKNMRSMFDGCHKLESIGNLFNWNVSSVENMTGMFYGCESLKSIGDISKWNITNIDMDEMFEDSGIINIPDWYKE